MAAKVKKDDDPNALGTSPSLLYSKSHIIRDSHVVVHLTGISKLRTKCRCLRSYGTLLNMLPLRATSSAPHLAAAVSIPIAAVIPPANTHNATATPQLGRVRSGNWTWHIRGRMRMRDCIWHLQYHCHSGSSARIYHIVFVLSANPASPRCRRKRPHSAAPIVLTPDTMRKLLPMQTSQQSLTAGPFSSCSSTRSG